MHRNYRPLMNWKSGLLLSCIGAMVIGAGPLNHPRRVDVQVATPIELDIDWTSVDGVSAMQAFQPVVPTKDLIIAETAQHEIGISLKNNRVSVLVHFAPTLARGADARLAVRNFCTQCQGVVKYEYGSVLPNVLNLRNIPAGDIAQLRNMPGVVRIEMDEYYPNLVNLHDATGVVNGLQSQITAAGFSADGAGIRVCVADTGIDIDHTMYSSRIDTAAGFDFANNDSNPDDDNGHGSHVAGIAVGGVGLNVDFGCGAGPQAFQGMAPAATLIGVKILNSAGGGFSSDIIAGIDHCADQSPSGGRADVINLSIGTGNFTSGACTHSWAVAANNAVAHGVVVVAASGNENNSNSMGSPACGANVIAVGATYKANYPTCEDNTTNWNWGSCVDNSPNQDQIVCFSNESDFLDVSAPGSNIWSASNAAGGGSITGKSGTSMASPMVAGLAALILSADPSLTPAEVRQIIRDGADDLGPTGFDRAYGFGRINATGSLALVSGGGCSLNSECDDGVFCNGAETCVASVCQAGTAVNCNDGVGCTDDSCNEGTNSCDNVSNNANCDNGLFCDGVETCNATLDCQTGTAVNCNDGVGCTDDSCNEGTNSCDNVANNANCDNGLFCDGAETCDAVNDCQAGSAVNCNDGVGCTDDSCNEGTNSCDNIANNANYNNGLFCDGAETCDAVNDCQAGSDPCPTMSCDEGANACVGCLVNGDCDDGVFCNGSETCSAGTCLAGTAINCNDGVGCTDDSCNEGTNSCDNTTNDANCNNGIFCDGTETCDAVNDCQAGSAVNCNDGVGCTDDSCNEGTNSCDNIANNANCDNGLFCDGAETCDAVNDCQAGTDPCPTLTCDEGTNMCVGCLVNGDCDDGVFCNGSETCSAGTCVSGTAVNCNDGVGCTDDSCNEGTNSCDNTANDANCNNGLFCDGTETCDAVNDCQAGSAVNCNDGVGCTDDSCNEGTNACDNVVNNANCPDDGLFCTGTESCDAINDCVSSGDPCLTGETCNESTNACDSTGPPAGEGFIISRNADFSTDDRSFTTSDTMYMMLFTDQVDFNDISKNRWELKAADGSRERQPFTNNFDGSYTASFDLSGLPSSDTNWTWKGEAQDGSGTRFKPSVAVTVTQGGGSFCGDGTCDAGEDQCSCPSDCGNPPGSETNCTDGVDEDCDGATDCNDADCSGDPACVASFCGDGTCDAGEDECSCSSDCGNPPGTETNCTDGIDDDCDGATDCNDSDCSGDPACNAPTGEGFILSLNADFSTDDRMFTTGDTIYMMLFTDQVDFNDISRERWELKDSNKNKVREPFTNHFNGTWTASFNLSGLPSGDTNWTWKGEAKDNAGSQYKPSTTITVN